MGALKVTIQKFYRVTGGSTQYRGITPDIIFPDSMGYAKNREQDLDYSLKWDKVNGLDYKMWDGKFYDLNSLNQKSKSRQKKNKALKKIADSVNYLIKRREETLVSLNEDIVVKEDKKREEMMKKFKNDKENKNILVSNFVDEIAGNKKIAKENKKKWDEDMKQRKEDWAKSIQKDPSLEETLHIINDMILSPKSVSMKK